MGDMALSAMLTGREKAQGKHVTKESFAFFLSRCSHSVLSDLDLFPLPFDSGSLFSLFLLSQAPSFPY